MVPECRAEEKEGNIQLLLSYNCKEIFFLEDVQQECSIFREKERKRCLKKQGVQGEAKLHMVLFGALNTIMVIYSLVLFQSENRLTRLNLGYLQTRQQFQPVPMCILIIWSL